MSQRNLIALFAVVVLIFGTTVAISSHKLDSFWSSLTGAVTSSIPPLTLTLTADPSTVAPGAATQIKWTTNYIARCSGTGDWNYTAGGMGDTQLVTNITASKTYTLTCSSYTSTATKSVTVNVAATTASSLPAPTLTLTASPTSGVPGTHITLTWSSANATSCVSSGGWSGDRGLSGSIAFGVMASNTYTLTCFSAGGASVTKSAPVTISSSVPTTPTTPAPTVTLTANQSTTGGTATLTWSSTNASACTATGAWTGSKGTSGSETALVTVATTYTLTCTGAGGSTSKSVSIKVPDTTTTATTTATTTNALAPTLMLAVSPTSINSGQTATLTWSSTNASSCIASGGWTGSKGLNGSQAITGTVTNSYTLTCTGAKGTIAKSATLAVQTLNTEALSPVVGPNEGITDAYGTTWRDLRIGAGGWISGMDIAADGTRIIRTDTAGEYLWDGTKWKQLWNTTSMPADDIWPGDNSAVYEFRIAPSNTNRFYLTYGNHVYRSDDKGSSWTRTNFPTTLIANAKTQYRMYGQKMAVDPANPNVVYAGSDNDGVYATTDAGSTWVKVGTVPVGTDKGAGITGIAFDSSAGTANGRTKIIYLSSWGNGVYRSTDAGNTWTFLAGGPTQVAHAVASNGAYYAVDEKDFWKYANGSWTRSAVGTSPHAVTVDPFNPNRIIAMQMGGGFEVSEDAGLTWSGIKSTTHIANDIPWLTTTGNYLSIGDIAFDPQVPGKLWVSAGVGVWVTQLTFPVVGKPTLVSSSYGIEQLVPNEVISPPGGKPLVASWDRPVFRIEDPDTYPSWYAPDGGLRMGWSADWASSQPSYIAANINLGNGGPRSSYSTDGGLTWAQFATQPVGVGGAIAVSTPTNTVIAPSNNGFPQYTKDGGETWKYINAPGAPTSGQSGYGWAYYFNRPIVAADRVNIGTFYIYNYLMGLYRSTDGGDTWTLVKSGAIAPLSTYHAKLRSVPGKAGNLFFTSSQITPVDPRAAPRGLPFMRSVDGGVTWAIVPNTQEVLDMGFGAPKTPGGYPTIYIAGWVNNVYGIYASTDNAVSWIQVGKYPKNITSGVATISGDMNKYGRVYIGVGGMGYMYGDIAK